MTNDLTIRPATELAQPALDIGGMVRELFATGKAGENAAALEKLLDVQIKMEDRNAVRMFNTDFVALQREMPKVQAVQAVPNKDGSTRYMFAPFDAIDDQARPLCLKFGFTYTFGEGEERAGKITKTCILAHIGGHSRTNAYTVRIGHGPPGCSESQADGAAHSYAKRGALCDALNIRIDKATEADPRQESHPITPDQATELERRVRETNSNIDAFLKFAGADFTAKNRWLTIPANRYSELDSMLRKKEGKR